MNITQWGTTSNGIRLNSNTVTITDTLNVTSTLNVGGTITCAYGGITMSSGGYGGNIGAGLVQNVKDTLH